MKSLQNVEIDNGTDQYHWHVMQRWSPWFAIALILSGISFFEPTLPSKVSSTALQDQIGAKSIVRNKHGFRFPKSKSPNNSFFNDFCCSSGIISKIKMLQKHPHVQKFTFTANQPTPSWVRPYRGGYVGKCWVISPFQLTTNHPPKPNTPPSPLA